MPVSIQRQVLIYFKKLESKEIDEPKITAYKNGNVLIWINDIYCALGIIQEDNSLRVFWVGKEADIPIVM